MSIGLFGTASSDPGVVLNIASVAASAAAKPNKLDPARVMGAKACSECHKAEFAQWMKTVHYRNDERLSTEAAVKYAGALNISQGNISKDSLCVTCHATAQKNSAGEVRAISGVSCESCHGHAGGDPGWLNRHAVYGTNGTKREQETAEHLKARMTFCLEQGKVGPNELYGIAKKCYECHIVGHEALIAIAGHKAGSATFELASWCSGEVRHNFHIDQAKNAEVSSLWLNPVGANAGKNHAAANRKRQIYVIGILAELETRLRIRATTNNPVFIGQLVGTIPGNISVKLAQVNAVAATEETKRIAGMLPILLGRLFAPQPTDEKFFNDEANKVEAAAKSFLANHDGSKLSGLDVFIPKPRYSENYKP
ncbi:MAG: cytochrome c family protein [Planctomycetes bacterium]|nr:cytochrome c family protein [Planctomycetota bacterium]